MSGQAVPLLTSRWATVADFERQLDEPGFVPVRISIGKPRFLPQAKDYPVIHELVPYGLLKKPRLAPAEFHRKYVARLEKAGVEVIAARLRQVHAEYLVPLVLLCYEDVHAGEVCHRRQFADWWLDQTGQEIPEADRLPLGDASG